VKATAEDIVSIVGLDLLPSWEELEPDVYYKDGEAYGLVGGISADDGLYYCSACTDTTGMRFTIGMLKHMIRLIKTEDICIITDTPEYFHSMANTLNRYGMRHELKGTYMASFNDKR